MEHLLDFVLTDQAGVFIVCANDLPFIITRKSFGTFIITFPPLLPPFLFASL